MECFDGLEGRRSRRPSRKENRLPARPQREEQRVPQAVGEEKLGRREADVVFSNSQRTDAEVMADGNGRAVRMHNPLGRAGRARGIHKETGIVGARGGGFERRGLRRHPHGQSVVPTLEAAAEKQTVLMGELLQTAVEALA